MLLLLVDVLQAIARAPSPTRERVSVLQMSVKDGEKVANYRAGSARADEPSVGCHFTDSPVVGARAHPAVGTCARRAFVRCFPFGLAAHRLTHDNIRDARTLFTSQDFSLRSTGRACGHAGRSRVCPPSLATLCHGICTRDVMARHSVCFDLLCMLPIRFHQLRRGLTQAL